METVTKPIEESQNAQSNQSTGWSDTTLQSLNRRVGKDHILLPKELFEMSVSEWSGVPVIYQEGAIHPDFDLVDQDPNVAAKAIGGRVVGSIQSPRVETAGHPRLMSALDVDDERVRDLYESGELGLSTGFRTTVYGDRIITPPKPNHVLLFREVLDMAQPVDQGALVHSTVTPQDIEGEGEPEIRMIPMTENKENAPVPEEGKPVEPVKDAVPETKIEHAEDPAPEASVATPAPASDEEQEEIESLKSELDAQKTASEELQSQLKAKDDELAAAKQALDAYQAAEAERKFSELVAALPEGMVHTEEMKHSLRAEIGKDPVGTITRILKASRSEGGETKPVGEMFANSEVSKEKNTIVRQEIGNLSPHVKKD